jgi:hypothetical protein
MKAKKKERRFPFLNGTRQDLSSLKHTDVPTKSNQDKYLIFKKAEN